MATQQSTPTPAPSAPKLPSTKTGSLNKAHEDKWTSTPPQVTSYLTYSRIEPSNDQSRHLYMSGVCGLGWRFQLEETFHYRKSTTNHRVQELVGQAGLKLLPHMCSSMPLSAFKVNVKIRSAENHAKEFTGLSIRSELALGTYEEPAQYASFVQLEIILTFDPASGLALPATPSIKTQKALHHSLDGPTFVDTKFYLFSAKIQGRPALPRPVYAKSLLLSDTSNYLRDLLSSESGFASGTPCDLRLDVPEEISKLDADLYEYEDDSDLEESDGPTVSMKGKGPENATERKDGTDFNDHPQKAPPNSKFTDGHAFAVNGTAHKTWKAFMYYTYTNTVQFNELKSQQTEQGVVFKSQTPKSNPEFVACSPKSMYRFADYADLPDLKTLAKEGITKSLSRSNIVKELFSIFTSKYQEIIEIEVNFLVKNFSGSVRRDFDEMLQMIVLGTQTHCFRVLAFTIKRLLGDNARSAWAAVDGTEKPIGGKKLFMFNSRDEATGEENPSGEIAGSNSKDKPTATKRQGGASKDNKHPGFLFDFSSPFSFPGGSTNNTGTGIPSFAGSSFGVPGSAISEPKQPSTSEAVVPGSPVLPASESQAASAEGSWGAMKKKNSPIILGWINPDNEI